VRGPKERWYRPAIDLLFSSAAKSYGARVIGIILSGVLEDGVTGLSAIKACGGITMVQAPEDALHPEMPHNALKKVKVDYSLPVAQISAQLLNLVQKHDSGSANSGSK
jgi:two-component system chemotaxis response regulator CheB